MSRTSIATKLALAALVSLSIAPLPVSSVHAAGAPAPALVGTIMHADGTPAAGARVVAVVLRRASPAPTPATILVDTRSGPGGTVQLAFAPSLTARQIAAANGYTLNVMISAIGVGDPQHAYFGTFTTPLQLGLDGSLHSAAKSFTISMESVNVPPLPVGPQPQNQCGIVMTGEGTTSAYTTVAELLTRH